MLWNKNISEQPIDFQIKESSNTFLQLPHLCYHGYFWGGNRLKIAPKIVHNKKKKNLSWAVHFVHLLQGATTGAGETGFACLAVLFSPLLR